MIADVRSKYKDSDRSQLETVADYLLGIFRESEVLFLNILADTPLSQVHPKSMLQGLFANPFTHEPLCYYDIHSR